ncbi:MAG: hypothetical protein IV100_25465, partial [Myxococcales bacterium]|nr:hypothetical protein [Myxococcales bacterium]
MRRLATLGSSLFALALSGCSSDAIEAAPDTAQVPETVSSDAPADDTATPDTRTDEPDVSDTIETDTSGPTLPFTIGDGDWVGVAVVDATPEGFETFTDLNGNHVFDGCRHEPAGGTPECPEPYDDLDGDKDFDGVFLAGFSELRAALTVHDPIEVRAIVFARGQEYVAIVSVDVIGLAGDRIERAQTRLGELGWDPKRVIVTSTHTHQGPDTRGLWGSPFDSSGVWSGARPEYNALLTDRIVEAVDLAAKAMGPVTLKVGATRMRDRSEWFSGEPFGGKSPSRRMQGLLNDIRDPIIVADQLLAIQAVGADDQTVATLLSFAGHPELVGDQNNALSADYVFFLRELMEARLGGRAVFVPESLGGMQSTLGGSIPMVKADGTWAMTTPDGGGEPVPVLSKEEGLEHARAAATHLADAAADVLASGDSFTLEPFVVRHTDVHLPTDNGSFQLLFSLGLFDVDPALAVKDPALCPWITGGGPIHPGCVPTTLWRVRLGAVEFLTAPGELTPELFWGLPDDPRFVAESEDPTKRGTGEGRIGVYFPAHPPACDTTPYDQCANELTAGACDCTDFHVWPYVTRVTGQAAPVTRLEAKYRFVLSMADDHLGYILPEPDFNRRVSALDGETGDHYEDTNSLTFRFSTLL